MAGAVYAFGGAKGVKREWLEVHAEQRFGDLVVPSRITVGRHFGTPAYRPFLEAEVRELSPAVNY